jgi:hypothetical protein
MKISINIEIDTVEDQNEVEEIIRVIEQLKQIYQDSEEVDD